MHACDGVVLVVDAVEGVMMQTERLARIALASGLSVCLVINKVRYMYHGTAQEIYVRMCTWECAAATWQETAGAYRASGRPLRLSHRQQGTVAHHFTSVRCQPTLVGEATGAAPSASVVARFGEVL
jgi:Elongation factor Tu GTP binding domain